jgi:crotonobetainyl-CoA:carnitine CoA-transferase CaiB-like acyl-CoA transferase
VLENFSPRVLEQVGLDAAGIQRRRPDAIVMRLPAWGLTSPWKDLPGFTYSADATSGLSDLTGYPDGDPLLTGTVIDPIAADTSTFVALAALRQRMLTGHGTVIEVSLCDVAPQLTAQATIESSRTGARVERRGNDGPGVSPQGMYQGADGTWVAISIASDDQWRALGTVTGGAGWATVPDHADLAGRQADRDRIDAGLRGFVGAQDPTDLVARLHAAGIPAAVMLSGEQAHLHPAVVARARSVELFHVVNGIKQHLGPPVRLSSNPVASIPRPSPLFGEHNDEVLTELGYQKDEIQRLRETGKIGDSPFGLPIADRHPPRD